MTAKKDKFYRVTFLHSLNSLDYWNEFDKCRIHYQLIFYIIDHAEYMGIKYIWFFFEPYVEITWKSPNYDITRSFLSDIKRICAFHNVNDVKIFRPKDGFSPDWYSNSEIEANTWGVERHNICRQLAQAYYRNRSTVDEGKGIELQAQRTIHTLCNPLGLNYKREVKICFSRGLICLLLCIFKYERAFWLYKNIFRQKT